MPLIYGDDDQPDDANDKAWLDYEIVISKPIATPIEETPPGPGGVYVLVRYTDGTADLPSLEEYIARDEPRDKSVAHVQAIRGFVRAVRIADQYRVLRAQSRNDQKAMERLIKQINNPPERTLIPSIEDDL